MPECIWRQQKDVDAVVQRPRLVLKTGKVVVKLITFRLSWQTNSKNNHLLWQSDWRLGSIDQPQSKRKTAQNVTDYLKTSNGKCKSKKRTFHLLSS